MRKLPSVHQHYFHCPPIVTACWWEVNKQLVVLGLKSLTGGGTLVGSLEGKQKMNIIEPLRRKFRVCFLPLDHLYLCWRV